MQAKLAQFAHDYRAALLDLLHVIPIQARAVVPPCVAQTSFVIAVCDPTGRVAIELRSRLRYPTITINGDTATPNSATEPGYVVAQLFNKLERVVFPGTTDSSPVYSKISGNAAFLGFTYASTEFVAAQGDPAFHAQFIGAEVPIEVLADGSILAVNLTNGLVVNGKPVINVTEWLRIFGSVTMLPDSPMSIRSLALTDLGSAVLRVPISQTAVSFSDFLGSLQGPIDRSVLVLGPYSKIGRMEEVGAAVGALGYQPFLLKDAPDLAIQKNLEKLFAAVIFSSFIVMIDDEPSGHLGELTTLLQFRFRPVILLRREDKPSTAFLEDSVRTSAAFRVEVMPDVSPLGLQPAIRWAREWLSAQQNDLNTINHWRSQ